MKADSLEDARATAQNFEAMAEEFAAPSPSPEPKKKKGTNN